MIQINVHERPAYRRLAWLLALAALLVFATVGVDGRTHQILAGLGAALVLGAHLQARRSSGMYGALGVQTGAAMSLVVIVAILGLLAPARGLTAASAHGIASLLLLTVLLLAAARVYRLLRPGDAGQSRLLAAASPAASALPVVAAAAAGATVVLAILTASYGTAHPNLPELHRAAGALLVALSIALAFSPVRRLPRWILVIQIALSMVNVLSGSLILLIALHSLLLLTAALTVPDAPRPAVRLPTNGNWRLEDRPV